MFSSSVRRAARTPSAPFPVVPRPCKSVVASQSSTPRTHQRRYSSSKPNDGSRNFDASSQTPGKSVNPSAKEGAEKREGRASKRKGKDGGANGSKHAAFADLPSVPSTQHIHPNDIYVASFFSIHRPMSVTSSVPANSTQDAFSSIFSKASQRSKHNNVVHTIASAAQSIEKAIQKKGSQSAQSSEESELRAAVAQASSSNAESNVTHLDGVPTQDLRESIQEFAKRLRPFNPPPAPVPVDEANSVDPLQGEEYESDPAYASSNETGQEQQSYSTVLTIRESKHPDGRRTYEAHTTPFVQVDELEAPTHFDGPIMEEPASERSLNVPSRFLDRMRIRQLRWDDFRERRLRDRSMHAISVKRIRKLKMKKHKYKKLMRKTRSLRRKLDKN